MVDIVSFVVHTELWDAMGKEPSQEIPVRFYRAESGGTPVLDWLRGLDKEDRRAIGLDLMRVQFGYSFRHLAPTSARSRFLLVTLGMSLLLLAFQVLLGRGLQPDREALREEQVERGGLGHDTARRGDDCLGVLLQHRFERAALVAAVGGEAVQRMNFGHAASGNTLDFAIQLDKGHAELIGEQLSERGLAGAAQSDQRDARAPSYRLNLLGMSGFDPIRHDGAAICVRYGKNTMAWPYSRGNCTVIPRHLPLVKSKATTSSRATQ